MPKPLLPAAQVSTAARLPIWFRLKNASAGRLCDTAVRIDAMDCPTEEALIRKQLSAMPEVWHLELDLLNRILTVHHENLTHEALQSALRRLAWRLLQPEAVWPPRQQHDFRGL
jgi:hypothetical protein